MNWFSKRKGVKIGVPDIVDYDFECVNHTDYCLSIMMNNVQNRLLLELLSKAKRALRANITDEQADNLKSFAIPQQYLKLIGTLSRKQINVILKQVRDDGIHVLSDRVSKADFVKDKEAGTWTITITVAGNYIDKR